MSEASNNTNQIQNSILAEVAQQAIEPAIASKGLEEVPESQTPDLILAASGGESQQTSWNTWGDAQHRRRHGWNRSAKQRRSDDDRESLRREAEGTRLAWHRAGHNGNKNQKEVQNAVNKMGPSSGRRTND
jgi:hypothetical protein